MRIRSLLALTGALLACACGSGAPPSLPADYHGVPVAPVSGSRYTDPPLVPAPPMLPPGARLGIDMENALAGQIGRDEPVAADCGKSLVFDGTLKTIRCSADWDGVAVPFRVTINGNARPAYSVRATQLQGLLVGAEVRLAWAQLNVGSSKKLSCDRILPKAVVVPFGQPTRYRCAAGTDLADVEILDVGSGTSPVNFDYTAAPA